MLGKAISFCKRFSMISSAAVFHPISALISIPKLIKIFRDPEMMRTHGYHWFDKARMARSAMDTVRLAFPGTGTGTTSGKPE